MFEFIPYDDGSNELLEKFKKHYAAILELSSLLNGSRSSLLCLTHLEESYMWLGKTIRDAKMERGTDKVKPVEIS